MFKLNLPVPPSANNLFPTSKSGHRYRSKAYESWKRVAGFLVRDQVCWPESNGPEFGMMILIPRKTRGDIANREKAITDLLVEYRCVPDDRYLAPLIMDRHDGDEAIVYVGKAEEFSIEI